MFGQLAKQIPIKGVLQFTVQGIFASPSYHIPILHLKQNFHVGLNTN